MKHWTKATLAGLGVVGVGCGLALGAGAAVWRRQTAQMIERLRPPQVGGAARTVSFKALDALPVPVARYFRFALTDGQPLVRHARIQQAGEFWLNGRWIPFTATQHVSAAPPGMVWDAEMRMNALLNVRVRDAFVAGRGAMQAKLLALVPMVDEHDKAELNAGALQRWLAEAVWLPTALWPSAHLQWSAVDEHRALATVTTAGITVSLEFHFDDAGAVTQVFSPERYRAVDGRYELTPWAGYYRDYQTREGMRIPLAGAVEWQLPDGRLPYCRLRIAGVEYAFAR